MTAPGGGSTRQVRIQISADVSQAVRSFAQVNDSLTGITRQGSAATQTTSSFGDKLKQGLATAGVATGFAAISSGLKGVVADGMDYERSQNQFQAVTGASVDEMKRAASTAKDLGNDIKLPDASAQTATAAMLELAKGGLTASEAMDAARGTMTLATAAQIDGATAAEIQANALNSFGLEADQAGRVANVLANVANKSSGEITDFADGLAQSSAVANMMGMSVEDTATALGLFANAGIKGSDAGTTLKTSITQLLNPSKESQKAIDELGLSVFDSQGNFVGYRSIVEQLSEAQGKMSQEAFTAAAAQVLGTDAVRAGAVVAAGGTAAWDDMAAALANTNGAMDMASANSKGLSGVIDAFKNSVDTASLSLFDALSPALQELTPALTSVVEPLADGLAPLLEVVADTMTGTLAPALEAAAGLIGAIADPLSDVIGWLNELPGPVSGAVLAIGGLVAFRGPVSQLWTSLTSGLSSTRASVTGFVGSMRAATGAMATAGTAARGLMGALGGPIGLAILGVTTALSFMGGKQEDVAVQTAGLSQALDEQTGKFKENADSIIARAAADGGSFDAYEKIGGQVEEYTQALLQNEGAQEAVHTRLLDQATAAVEASDGYARAIEKGSVLPGTAREIASGLLETGDAAQYGGQGLEAVIDASNRFAADSQQITDAQRQNRQATEASTEAANVNAGAIAGVADASAAAGGPVDGLASSGQSAAEAFKAHADALKAATDNAKTLADVTELSTYLGGVKNAADDANRSMDYFKALQDELTGKTRSLNDAVAAQNGALASVSEAFREGTRAATENSEAGNLNVQALREWDVNALTATTDGRSMYDQLTRLADQHVETANAAYQDAVQHGNVAGAADVARAAADENRRKFLELADQYGITGGDADALADKLGIVAGAKIEDKDFKIIADDKAAQDALRAAQAAEIADKTFRITALANVDQAALDAANAKADQFFAGTKYDLAATDYAAIKAGKADGGYITGPGTGTSDSIPVNLSNGEFIVRASQTAKHRGLLEDINAGRRGFADGGLVGGSAAPGDASVAGGVSVAASVPVPDVTAALAAWQALADGISAAWAGVTATISAAQAAIVVSEQTIDAATVNTGLVQRALLDTQITPVWLTAAATVAGAQAALQGTYDAFNAGTSNVGATQRALLDGQVTPVWDAINAKVSGSWSGPITSTYAGINAGTDEVGRHQSMLRSTTDTEWSAIGARISSTTSGQIVPAWSQVQSFADATGSFFAGVNSGVASASEQVTSDIDQIRSALDEFFKLVDGRSGGAAGGATQVSVQASGVQALADGGMITAGTGPRADDVWVRASKGEYVVNAKATAANRETLDRINYGGAYADGGLIADSISVPLQNALVTGTQNAVQAGVTKMLAAFPAGGGGYASNGQWGPATDGSGLAANTQAARDFIQQKWGINDIGGVYGGSVPGSDHPVGKALDVMIQNYLSAAGIAQGTSVADWFVGNPNAFGTKYVIWRDRINQGGSWAPYQHPSGNDDNLQHRNHVHLSFLTGGGSFSGGAVAADDDPKQGGWLGSIVKQIKAGGTTASNNPSPVAGGKFDPNVERWRPLVMQALAATGEAASNADAMLNQIRSESSGDPNAINLYDINAQRGYPSQGLLQVIRPTFESALRGTQWENLIPRGMTDPWANFIASILYARGRYGSLQNAYRGVAYATGGMVPGFAPGQDTVQAMLSPGEAVISRMPGFEGKNKALVAEAAGWFGGAVQYPDDRGYPSSARDMQQMTRPTPIDVRVTFSGDGPITKAMIDTANVQIDVGYRRLARQIQTSMAQG